MLLSTFYQHIMNDIIQMLPHFPTKLLFASKFVTNGAFFISQQYTFYRVPFLF